MTVSLDKDKIETNIEKIFSAYNDVVKFVNQKSVHSSELGISGPLVGETAVTRVLRNIQSVVSDEY